MENSYRVICKDLTCNRSFESPNSMKQHYEACHSAKQDEQQSSGRYAACKLCNRFRFKTKDALQDHMRTAHLYIDGPDSDYPLKEDSPMTRPLLQSDHLDIDLTSLACNDCGKTAFKSVDALHQHQWASAGHTRVSKSQNPNLGTRGRTCSQCNLMLPSPEGLEQHFMEEHPLCEVQKLDRERTWQSVANQFREAWIKPTMKLYDVHRIFKVYNPGWRRRDFEVYRKQIKKQMSNQKLVREENLELRNQILCDGNELLRYHGTTVSCRLGRPFKPSHSHDKGVASGGESLSLCSDLNCSLCRILQTGFQKSKCRVKNFQRFGRGIYCSSASSKSAAYVKCTSPAPDESCLSWLLSCLLGGDGASVNGAGNYKVMMVCRVIAGRPHHSTRNLKELKSPPHGFHSVQGDPGEVLNYDELVVYDDSAILPAYIVLYTSSD